MRLCYATPCGRTFSLRVLFSCQPPAAARTLPPRMVRCYYAGVRFSGSCAPFFCVFARAAVPRTVPPFLLLPLPDRFLRCGVLLRALFVRFVVLRVACAREQVLSGRTTCSAAFRRGCATAAVARARCCASVRVWFVVLIYRSILPPTAYSRTAAACLTPR